MTRPADLMTAIVSKYEADRAHELELNKFSHVFEVERLRLLQIFNTSAFGALAAIIGTTGIFTGLAALAATAVAILAWLGGLWLAFQATQTALDAQVEFARAYHNRRRATEWRLHGPYFSDDELRQMIKQPPKVDAARSLDAAFDHEAATHRTEGDTLGKKVRQQAGQSVKLFILGGAALLAALLLDAREQTARPDYAAEVDAAERDRVRALVAADMTTARNLHADDFEVIGRQGLKASRSQFLGYIASGAIDYVAWEPLDIEVRRQGRMAAIRYRARLEMAMSGQRLPPAQTWNTGLYEKRAGRWQIVRFQVTDAPAGE